MPQSLRLVVLSSLAMMVVLAAGAGARGTELISSSSIGACTKHANLLYRACLADRKDDLLVHRADCAYVTPREDAQECRAEARAEADEKAEECSDVHEARLDLCDLLGQGRFDIEFDPADIVDPNDIGVSVDPSPYFPLTAGYTHVIITDDEVVVFTATEEVREVGGLPCRVIRDIGFEEGEDDEGNIEYEAVEVTRDWYAQNLDGDVIYCGENTYEVEDGLVDNTDGSFANGTDRARAGTLVRGTPAVGEADRQEMATDEAEDFVEYVSLAASPSDEEGGEAEAFPCDGGCLQTLEVNPHDAGQAEYKYYLPGTGFVLATKLEDGEPTGEREEVTCIGDSLDVLNDPSCGIGDVDALFEALCLWAPDAFCDDE